MLHLGKLFNAYYEIAAHANSLYHTFPLALRCATLAHNLDKRTHMDKLVRNDEEKLIARSQQGDIGAFNQLVLYYQQIVYNTVFRLLGNYDTAADVTQETFISAFRAIHTYRGRSPFRIWLLRIGTNQACDHW